MLFRKHNEARWKSFDFIERKLLENEIENFLENTSKFAKILDENERILLVHFCKFRSKKRSMETLSVRL